MSGKISVKDLKKPDKILKALRNFVSVISSNFKNLIYFIVFLILVVSLIVFYNYRTKTVELTASKKLFELKKGFDENLSNENKINKYKEFLKNVKKSNAKTLAKFYLAKLYFDEENYLKTIELLNEIQNKELKEISHNAKFLKAISLTKLSKYNEAIDLYDYFINNNLEQYVKKALWNKANIYIKMDNVNKAVEVFDTITIKYPKSNYADLAIIARNKINNNKIKN